MVAILVGGDGHSQHFHQRNCLFKTQVQEELMYFAMVFFCLTGGECLVAEDSYSPYPTQAQCDARVAEMKKQIIAITPLAEIKSSICKQLGSNA